MLRRPFTKDAKAANPGIIKCKRLSRQQSVPGGEECQVLVQHEQLTAKVAQCLYRTRNVGKACGIVLKDAVCLQRARSVYNGCKVAEEDAKSLSRMRRFAKDAT